MHLYTLQVLLHKCSPANILVSFILSFFLPIKYIVTCISMQLSIVKIPEIQRNLFKESPLPVDQS